MAFIVQPKFLVRTRYFCFRYVYYTICMFAILYNNDDDDLCDIHILIPFHLILTRGPIILTKSHLRVILG